MHLDKSLSRLVRLTTLLRRHQPAILHQGLLARVPKPRTESSVPLATEDPGKDQHVMCETFGDNICKKEKDKLRIGFLNIGGLSVQQDNFKDEELRKGISTWEFDIFGIAETNIDWRLVPEKDRLFARTREWRESIHLSFSYNVTTPPVDRRQWGGNALFSIDKAAHRVVEKGSDPFKLGRWCWTMYRGRDNHILKVYSAYCPTLPLDHYRFLHSKGWHSYKGRTRGIRG